MIPLQDRKAKGIFGRPPCVPGVKLFDKVNRHEHRNRQRFTIAHEIAHYVLHRDVIGNELVDDTFYRSGLSEQREWEANALAAEILMPWHLITEIMRGGERDVEKLAEALQVSPAAMNIRLGVLT